MEWTNRSACMFVKADPREADAIWERFQSWPQTIGCWIVTGEYGMIVWYDAKTAAEMKQRAAEVREWKGVWHTSSHFVDQGWKNGQWWWNKPTGCWVMARDTGSLSHWGEMQKWDGWTSAMSLPGDWDYMAWVAGDDWNQTHRRVWEAAKKGWETQTVVPLRSWWNEKWQGSFWA